MLALVAIPNVILCVVTLTATGQKPDFSGLWGLDPKTSRQQKRRWR
jgi:hypothetical protein